MPLDPLVSAVGFHIYPLPSEGRVPSKKEKTSRLLDSLVSAAQFPEPLDRHPRCFAGLERLLRLRLCYLRSPVRLQKLGPGHCQPLLQHLPSLQSLRRILRGGEVVRRQGMVHSHRTVAQSCGYQLWIFTECQHLGRCNRKLHHPNL